MQEVSLGQLSLVPASTPAQTLTEDNDEFWEVPEELLGNDQMELYHQETAIKPRESAKYLGIWLDKTLSFKTHRAKVLAKANATLEALKGISGSTWGANLLAMRRIYLAVVVPQLLYSVAAWYSPTGGRIKASENQFILSEFKKIQKRAAILISGTFKSTAGTALDLELYILPIKWHMQQIIEETAIRIRTGPEIGCPRSLLRPRSGKKLKHSGPTPLEAMQRREGPLTPLVPNEIWETRRAYILAPWETPLTCSILGQEAAVSYHNKFCRNRRGTAIYTDGSGFLGHIGTSAVCLQTGKVQRKFLGTEAESTVYAAELRGLQMALVTAASCQRQVAVFVDSQAAIKAAQNPGRPSGQFLLRQIYTVARRYNLTRRVGIHWIPAHIGVPGNERADEAAKEAATDPHLRRRDSPVRLAAAAKQTIRLKIHKRWEDEWTRDAKTARPTATPTHRLFKGPDKKVLQLWKGLSKPHTAITIQMRTHRIGLRHFLYKINAVESDRCSCEKGSQTSRHILQQCPLYTDLRAAMLDKINRIRGLRGKTADYNVPISHPQAIRYIAEFIHKTGLLSQFREAKLTTQDTEPINKTNGAEGEDAG